MTLMGNARIFSGTSIRQAIKLYRHKRSWNNRLMTAVFDYYELAHSDPHPNPLPAGEGGRRPGEGICRSHKLSRHSFASLAMTRKITLSLRGAEGDVAI